MNRWYRVGTGGVRGGEVLSSPQGDKPSFPRVTLERRYTIPSRLRLRLPNSPALGIAPTLAVTAPVITFCNATWNCSISGAVPIVMRT